MLQHYIKTTIREFSKYKTQSIISIVGLAIGFTACVLGSYWLWWETHFDNFHPEAGRLYCLTTEGLVKRANSTNADLNQIHINDRVGVFKLLPEIEAACSFSPASYTLKRENESITIHGIESDATFFNLFHADFIAGTYKGLVPDGTSIILNETTARKLFGTTDCIGKEVVLDDHVRPTVAGVIRDYPDNTDLIFQFLQFQTARPNQVQRLTTYVRLHPEANISAVRAKLAKYKSQATNRQNKLQNWTIHILSAAEVHLNCHPELTDRIRNIHILALAGVMAFLSALINLLVLFIGQQQRKQQKNRTYFCLGASFKSMLLKGFTELGIPMILAFLVAICLIEIIFPYYESYTAWNRYGIYENVSRRLSRSSLFGSTASIAISSIVLFFLACYYPIRSLLAQKIQKPVLFKHGLIVVQIFISSLFFVTSLVLFKQLYYILSKDKGIQYEQIIQVDLGYDTAFQTDLRVLKPEIANHPYVESVTYTCGYMPVFTEQGDWYGSFETHFPFNPEDSETDATRTDRVVVVDKDFFSCFGIQLQAGEYPTEKNSSGILVNETAYRQLGYNDLFSRSVYNPEEKQKTSFHVCGMVNDYLYAPMQYPILPLFFAFEDNPLANNTPAYLYYVRYISGHKKEVLDHLRKVTLHIQNDNINRDKVLTELSTVVDTFNRPEKVIFTIFSILALLCILISTFGIYSLVSLSAEQRRKEIAIRKVNGATLFHILQLFFREYLLLVTLGNAFALPVGYLLMKRWLETYANHTDLSAWLFVLVFFITSCIVVLSIFRQVQNASRTNPAEVVKSE